MLGLESSRLYDLGTQKIAYDAEITLQYAAAVTNGDDKLATFIRESLVRPPYLPYLDEWEAQVKAGDPAATNLFTNEQYLNEQWAASKVPAAEADAAILRSEEASQNVRDYLVMTLLTASTLFFAGVTSSFKGRLAKSILIILSATLLAYTLARLTGLRRRLGPYRWRRSRKHRAEPVAGPERAVSTAMRLGACSRGL